MDFFELKIVIIFLRINLNMFLGAQKNCLIETVLRDENSQTFSIQKTCLLDPEWSQTDF